MPPATGVPYAELQVTTNYSFLRGASHVEELLLTAKALGLAALGVTDHNTLAGTARAHARAAEASVRLVAGCRLDLRDNPPVLAYPTSRAAYAGLCRLLTLGKGRTGKGGCDLAWTDLVLHGDGLLLVLLPDQPDAVLADVLTRLRAGFPGPQPTASTPLAMSIAHCMPRRRLMVRSWRPSCTAGPPTRSSARPT